MKPKLAVADLLLHSPPKGGACVDLFNVLRLLSSDFEICVFCPRWPSKALERGRFDSPPPFETRIIETKDSRASVVEGLVSSISEWKPDVALIGDAWTLKPFLVNELKKRWPLVARFYAYEALCPRNNERWRFDAPCPCDALSSCAECLACAKDYCDVVRLKRGSDNPLTEEMRIAGIFDGSYEDELRRAFKGLRSIVYNKTLAKILREKGGALPFVAPGGVDCELFHPSEEAASSAGRPGVFRILSAGRMNDPAKGAAVVIEACRLLVDEGLDLQLTMTRPSSGSSSFPWLAETGWKSPVELAELMRSSDCSVVPSIWEEAFGMVWAESMASGLPVVVSAVAGPLEYVADGENGLLFPPGDAQALASCLRRLALDAELRRRLASAGLATARERLRWENAARVTKSALDEALAAGRAVEG